MNGPRRLGLALLAAALAGCGDHEGGAPKDAGAGPQVPAKSQKSDDALLAAYDRGLDFLLGKQKDGVWSAQGKPNVGFTALAITPVLERPGGARASDKAVVDKSLAFLAKSLGEDGGVKSEFTSNYETSAVVMALAASGRKEYAGDIQRAAGFIKKLQYADPAHPSYGGIGYGDDGPRSDLSNTYYALASLEAAGVPKDDPLYQKALAFLQRCQNRKENEGPGEPTEWKDEKGEKVVRGNDGGGFYYPGESKAGTETLPDGSKALISYGSMTYALLRCYHMAGLDAKDPRFKSAVEWISRHWATDRNPGMPDDRKRDGLYYYLSAVAKTLPAVKIDVIRTPDGREVNWRSELSAMLVSQQKPDGSWQNAGPRWFESDPVLATGYALTALGPCVTKK